MARDALPVVPQTDRLFTAATVGLSEKDFQAFRHRVQEFLDALLMSAAKEDPNRVYQVNFAVFPVSLYSDAACDPRTVAGNQP